MNGNFEPIIISKISSMENSSRANTQEQRFQTNQEKFKHTKLGEIDSRKFNHTKLGETKITKHDFQTFRYLQQIHLKENNKI